MCKAFNVRFACMHYTHVRLSTCRGIKTTRSISHGKARVACRSYSDLVISLQTACAFCLLDKAERASNSILEVLHCRHEDLWNQDEDTSARLRELAMKVNGEELFAAEKLLPTKRFVSYEAPKAGVRTACMRRGSLLAREVLPEEVVDYEGFEVVTDDPDFGWGSVGWFDDAYEVFDAVGEPVGDIAFVEDVEEVADAVREPVVDVQFIESIEEAATALDEDEEDPKRLDVFPTMESSTTIEKISNTTPSLAPETTAIVAPPKHKHHLSQAKITPFLIPLNIPSIVQEKTSLKEGVSPALSHIIHGLSTKLKLSNIDFTTTGWKSVSKNKAKWIRQAITS